MESNTNNYIKNFWSQLTLYKQNVLVTAFALLIVLSTYTYFLSTKETELIKRTTINNFNSLAKNTAFSCADLISFNDFTSIENLLLSTLSTPYLLEIKVINSNFKTISHVSRGRDGKVFLNYDANILPPETIKKIKEQKSYNEDFSKDGTTYWQITSGGKHGWVYLRYDLNHVKNLSKENWRYNIIASFSALFIILSIVFLIMRNNHISLRRASSFAKTLSDNQGNILVSYGGSIEINELISSLNQASIKLKEQQQKLAAKNDELIKLNTTLEEKVATRTKELAESYRELEKSSKAKSEFLANMSHEIRTPLNSIIGTTQILLENESNEDIKSLVKMQRLAGENLLSLINNILDISKIEANRLTIENIPFNLYQVVNKAISLLIDHAYLKGLKLTFEIEKNLPHNFRGDPTRISQILINLLNNAIKFTENGKISVYIRCIEKKDDALMLQFSVKDTGIGITKENQHKMFEVFSQADSTITRNFGGTGLGLAICKKLVQSMGGDIQVESNLGIGSTFSFYLTLPIVLENEIIDKKSIKEDIKIHQAISPFKKLNVLIVDDDPSNLHLMSLFLKSLNPEIITARNGKDAFELFKQMKFDIVLMDMQMPVMDGLTATSEIRNWEAQQNYEETPILMVTANAFKEDEEKSASVGASGFLSKPVNKKSLIKAIEEFTNV